MTDLPAAVAFYEAMLGHGPFKQVEGFAKFVVDDPAINLALSAAPRVVGGPAGAEAPPPVGVLSHLGFQVDGAAEVRAIGERWDAAGLPTKHGGSFTGNAKVWVYDPDGNEWEVFSE